MPVTQADVLLTFCTYKVLYAKNPGGKNYRGNLPGGVLIALISTVIDSDDEMREVTCARTPTSKAPTRIGSLVDYLFCDLAERSVAPPLDLRQYVFDADKGLSSVA